MNRRAFLWALVAGLLRAPLPSIAQPARTPTVGFVSSGSQSIAKGFIAAFRQGLSEAGYFDGQNVTIEYRWADGHYDRLPALATDLIKDEVGVIAAVDHQRPWRPRP